MRVMVVVMCVVGLLSAGVACGGSSSSSAATTKKPDRFDAGAAMALTRLQVGYGQRPAGSPQLRKLAGVLVKRLPAGRLEALPSDKGLRNVVGTLPGKRPGLVIGAHYDTLVKPEGFVGANNGAAGSAIVIELARALKKIKRPAGAREIRFVLFDGEEPDAGLPEEQPDFYKVGLRGSKAYLERHPGRTAEMILLDYVGNKGLRLPREGTSDIELWARIRAAAKRAGHARTFPDDVGQEITDDHTPFLRAGVPAVDLIDWSYDGHSLNDGLDKLSTASMDAVGETLLEYVLAADRG